LKQKRSSHEDILATYTYFAMKAPKSTGRELFNADFLKTTMGHLKQKRSSHEDILATYTSFSAQSICHAYENHLPQLPERVVLCGGGVKNLKLVQEITRELHEAAWVRHLKKHGHTKKFNQIEVVTSEDLGWPAESIEASAFALLAYQTMNGLEGNIPQTTGAKRSAVLGQLTFPG
jgi:anhydro-N-acetylmuramic acid kinase